jgi:hypothetical protein
VKAWGNAPGKEKLNFEALKARHSPHDQYFAPSALGRIQFADLGRWPRLSHFAPLALGTVSFDTGSEL